jgi:trehalose 6-phosphate synthase
MSDLVIVSNRGPFSFSRGFLTETEDSLRSGVYPKPLEFGEGGLVQAMASLLKPGKWSPTWIGASMGDRDIDVARGHYRRLFNRMVKGGHAPNHFPRIMIERDGRMRFHYREYDFYLRFVYFDTRHMHSYYDRFANGFLWPLLHLTRPPLFYRKIHGFPRPHFEKNDFVQYMSSGVTFANTISDEIDRSKEFRKAGNDIVVWNQDYHLMQIAEVLKAGLLEEGLSDEKWSRIRIGQFMHTPYFNIHEIQHLLREDKRNRVKAQLYDPFGETLESVLQKLTWGMLANDFIGFHTNEYCSNYLEALEEWFPVKIRVEGECYEVSHLDQITTIAAIPIGLDVGRILSEVSRGKNLSYSLGRESLYRRIRREKTKGLKIFGGLERCDYTKGLLERLGIFYHAHRRLKDIGTEARLYQVTAPSRQDNEDYQKLNSILTEAVQKYNSMLPNEPIVHIDQGIPVPQNYRFMKEIDVMLVTPLEDGMNLVAFEYILSQKYKNPSERGFLVLSTSGASRVLKEKGFGQEDGIVYVNPMRTKEAGVKTVDALMKQVRLSEKVINYVEQERRVDDWAEKNVDAILNCRKTS